MTHLIPAEKLSGESQNELTLTLTLKDSHQNKLLEFTQPIIGMQPDVTVSTILSALASLIPQLTGVLKQQPGSWVPLPLKMIP